MKKTLATLTAAFALSLAFVPHSALACDGCDHAAEGQKSDGKCDCCKGKHCKMKKKAKKGEEKKADASADESANH